MLRVWIPGRPVPQGSATIQRFNTAHRGTVVSSNKDRLLPWRAAIAATVADAWTSAPIDHAASVVLEFRFARPKGHFGTGRNASVLKASAPMRPTSRGQGDVDKLARAVLDGLTDGGALADDSCVTVLQVSKVWAPDGKEGVAVVVMPLAGTKPRRVVA